MTKELCPCGSGTSYTDCCEIYLSGKEHAPSRNALMRSRYTAHVKGNAAYCRDTLAPEVRKEFNEKEFHEWSKKAKWMGLEILGEKGNVIEFIAKYAADGKVLEHHEHATFRKDPKDQRWYFVDGDAHVHEEGKGHNHHHKHDVQQAPVVREAPKVGRNDPCSCGSGKKFKKCCGA